ncbi:MAG: MFS transporter [Paracoccus sp. (in: a-proteobacteria)]|uniref:MFS transporter n=1 Tax=Paracoccus sp. TaxID=267 RepID=UPI0026E0AE95|nr:MFS transporter [Paracoccus sp. (in: a-proteobacteria)]MDO5622896.1 MFS transporter [Paracoccus sp. (in: a-proteobacteria)]
MMVSEDAEHGTAKRFKMLALICLGVICSMTPWFSATAVLPELRAMWDLSPGMSAILTNGVQAGFVMGALGMSLVNLADILPPIRLMTAGAALAGLFTFLVVVVGSAEGAMVLRFLTGFALALVYPPAMKLTTTWFVRGRGLAMGLVIGGLTLGSAMPHLVRSLTSTVDWRVVLLASAAISVTGAAIFLLTLREGPYPYSRAKFDLRQAARVFRSRPVALANLGYFGHMWELYAMWAWLLVYTQHMLPNVGVESPGRIASLIVFSAIAAGVAGAIAGGVLADRFGRTLTTAGMMIVSGTCAIMVGLTYNGPLWLFLIIVAIWGASVIGDSAQFSAMVTEVADKHLVGTALTMQMGIGFLITILSIQLLPLIADLIGGWRWAFLALIPGPIIGTIAILWLRNMPESLNIAHGRR